MPQNQTFTQQKEPSQFPEPQLPRGDNKRMLWIAGGIGVALVIVVGVLLLIMGTAQPPTATNQQQTGQQSTPAPETADPVEEVSEGTTIGDVEADLQALEPDTSLPDLDAETQSLNQETQGF